MRYIDESDYYSEDDEVNEELSEEDSELSIEDYRFHFEHEMNSFYFLLQDELLTFYNFEIHPDFLPRLQFLFIDNIKFSKNDFDLKLNKINWNHFHLNSESELFYLLDILYNLLDGFLDKLYKKRINANLDFYTFSTFIIPFFQF